MAALPLPSSTSMSRVIRNSARSNWRWKSLNSCRSRDRLRFSGSIPDIGCATLSNSNETERRCCVGKLSFKEASDEQRRSQSAPHLAATIYAADVGLDPTDRNDQSRDAVLS